MSGSGLNTKLVSGSSFPLDVAMGKIPGISSVIRSGFNNPVGGTLEDIWNVGGQQTYLTAAETMDIVSDSLLDEVSGTGAQTMRIEGLDNNFDEIQEEIALDGTNVVVTANSYIRVFDMTILTAGSTEENQGTISATSTTSTSIQGQIDPGVNGSLTVQYTIPNNKTGFVSSFNFTTGSADQNSFSFVLRFPGEVFVRKNINQIISNSFQLLFASCTPLPGRSDLRILARQLGGGSTSVSSIMQLFLAES